MIDDDHGRAAARRTTVPILERLPSASRREIVHAGVTRPPRRRATAFPAADTSPFVDGRGRLALSARRDEARARATRTGRGAALTPVDSSSRRGASALASAAPGTTGREAPCVGGRPWSGSSVATDDELVNLRVSDHWRSLGEIVAPMRSLTRRTDMVRAVESTGPAADSTSVARMRWVIGHPMTIAAAIAASGLGDDGLPAVMRLIIDGHVRIRDGWSIAVERTVEPVPGDDGGEA